MPVMKDKKSVIIGLSLLAVATIFAVFYLWSLGIFSGSDLADERNPYVEELVAERVSERLSESFEDHQALNFVSSKAAAIVYDKDFSGDKYKEGVDLSEADIDKIIKSGKGLITIEVSFEGKSLEFEEYKHLVFKMVETIRNEMEWTPSEMQVFYYRYAQGDETENVMQYESKVPGYLFDREEKTVVTASGVHFRVELDDELATKTKIYIIVRVVYTVALTITIVALLILFIVRSVKKRKKYKK